MKLFHLNEKYELEIDPEAYELKVFAKLWDRDKTDNKRQAKSELAYIYYMMDFKSDFFEISNSQERSDQIMMNLNMEVDPDDEDLNDALLFYEKHTKTKIMYLLEDAYKAIDTLRNHFQTVDLTEKDEKGRVVHDSTKLMKNIADLGQVVAGLEKLEFQVKKQKQADSKLRAGREKGMFEDDI
jgi:hypothetical protein